jgi:hypothetical protein
MEEIKSELMQTLTYNLHKAIPKPNFQFQRILFWNTILRNSFLNSLNYIHIYIEKFEDILKSDNSKAIAYIKNIILKNKLNDYSRCYKIRFLLDGFDGVFLYKRKEFKEENLKDLKRDLLEIAEKMNYKFEIIDANIIKNKYDKIQKIDIFIKELYLPFKYI